LVSRSTLKAAAVASSICWGCERKVWLWVGEARSQEIPVAPGVHQSSDLYLSGKKTSQIRCDDTSSGCIWRAGVPASNAAPHLQSLCKAHQRPPLAARELPGGGAAAVAAGGALDVAGHSLVPRLYLSERYCAGQQAAAAVLLGY
jgi:hypothetical protein